MTQKDKELLIKDLCARLPYRVKYMDLWNPDELPTTLCDINVDVELIMNTDGFSLEVEKCKPYLFPLSSMTEEQKEELKHEISKQTDILIERMKNDDCGIDCGKYHFHSILELEWLLKNHFDFRGLIPKGLAIDATDKNIY